MMRAIAVVFLVQTLVCQVLGKKDSYNSDRNFFDNTMGYCKVDKVREVKTISDVTLLPIINVTDFVELDYYLNLKAIGELEDYIKVARSFLPPAKVDDISDLSLIEALMIREFTPIPDSYSTACLDLFHSAMFQTVDFFMKFMAYGDFDPTTVNVITPPSNSAAFIPLDQIKNYLFVMESFTASFDQFIYTVLHHYEVMTPRVFLDLDFKLYTPTWEDAVLTAVSAAPKFAAVYTSTGEELLNPFLLSPAGTILPPLYAQTVATCAIRPPTALPTAMPSFGPIGFDEEMTVISVLDRAPPSLSISATDLDVAYNLFRDRFPSRRFCLLQPKPAEAGELSIPARFFADARLGLSRYNQTKSDFGQPFDASNWFDICDLYRDAALKIPKVAVMIGVNQFRVSASVQLFLKLLAQAGITYETVLYGGDGDWITPHNRFFFQPNSLAPSSAPSKAPSIAPSQSSKPSVAPAPSNPPTKKPTGLPTKKPTSFPTRTPTKKPTGVPTRKPTSFPTNKPTAAANDFEFTLSLGGVPAATQALFVQAAIKWESVITAALPPQATSGALSGNFCTAPTLINNNFVCARFTTFSDSRVIGTAQVIRARNVNNQFFWPYFGEIQLANSLLSRPATQLEDTIRHELGHLLGIGSMWGQYGLINRNTPTCTYLGAEAAREYNVIAGCQAAPRNVPIEQQFGAGSQCVHWANNCFLGREVMSSVSSQSGLTAVSKISVGTLRDMGYAVDYSKADSLAASQLATTCRCVRRFLQGEEVYVLEEEEQEPEEPEEQNDDLYLAAREVGLSMLQEAQANSLLEDDGTQPGSGVLVLVEKNGGIEEYYITAES